MIEYWAVYDYSLLGRTWHTLPVRLFNTLQAANEWTAGYDELYRVLPVKLPAVEITTRECIASDCSRMFIISRADKRYHDYLCREAHKQKRRRERITPGAV